MQLAGLVLVGISDISRRTVESQWVDLVDGQVAPLGPREAARPPDASRGTGSQAQHQA